MPKTGIARIVAIGSYLPEKVLSNIDLEKMVDTSDEWIGTRTGIRERRIAAENEHPSDMGVKAAEQVLKKAQISPEAVDVVLVATSTPDYLVPSTAALIQHEIGAENAAAFDIQAACTGFLYGLSIAKAYIESRIYRTVLLIAPEKFSSIIDYEDRSTCVLFGDGAAAALITAEGEGFVIDNVHLGADGSLADTLLIPAGGTRHPASKETVEAGMHYVKMSGQQIFRHAVRRMEEAANASLKEANLEVSDLYWIVPHQANVRILEALAKRIEVDDDIIYKTVHKYGNTSASSLIIALDELTEEHTFSDGEHVLLVAFGAGLTWGASIVTYTQPK